MDFSWKRIEHKWRRELLSHAQGHVLEVGVGTGDNFKHYRPGSRITATDGSSRIIEQAKKVAFLNDVKPDFIVSPIEELELKEHSFDTIVSTFSLSAYENPVEVLNRFSRWCKPGGLILLLEYGLSKCGIVNWVQQKWEPFYHNKTGTHINRDMIAIISNSKFRIKRVEIKYAGIVYLVWASLITQVK